MNIKSNNYEIVRVISGLLIAGRNLEENAEKVVGVERFELPTSWSQTRRATRLRYTPKVEWLPELDLNQRPID